jgi:uncharacterized lipoprotein YmbA
MLGISLLILTACGTTAPTRFYTLAAAAKPSAPLQDPIHKPLAVEVVPFRVPQYLDRPQIVTRSGPHRLELAEFHQWGGNLRKNMTRVLVQNLSSLLGTTDVRISPSRTGGPPDARIELEVLQFERCEDMRVRLSVQWMLTLNADSALRTTRITTMESPPIADKGDYNATVSAMSDLLAELSSTVARAVLQQTAGRPGA